MASVDAPVFSIVRLSCSFINLCRLSTDSAIVNGVFWSEALNKVFVDNFERDPSLIWQYFGSAKGFFRQYPGEVDGGSEGGQDTSGRPGQQSDVDM